MADLAIPKAILDEMIVHAREVAPHECCGLLAGSGPRVTKLYRIKNIVAIPGADALSSFDQAKMSHLARLSPEERAEIAFVMDAHEQALALRDMRKQGLELRAVYHSHPESPARPSVTDIKNATEFDEIRDKLNLPQPFHLIISLMASEPDVRAYRIADSRSTAAAFAVV
ncbi:MAG TPA: M67 family metallopeptidase [Nitrospirales bacterium]|nr:M67 family metallopeptidase [Nitrospirales bacterium]